MSERDALMSIVAPAIFAVRDDPYDDAEWREIDSADKEQWECYAAAASDAVLAAGYRRPRVIQTADELDKLPPESTVIDIGGDVWQKRGGYWCSYETAPASSYRVAKYSPLTVLQEGSR